MTHDMAQSSSDMGEILCSLHGAEAAETVRKRDVLGVTLPEALASLAKVAHAHPDDPNVLALKEVFRQYTVQVYAHPAWTQADAWAYAKQECFRAKQVSDQQIERQSTCRMQGVIAEATAKERDTKRTSRTTVLAGYDRALRDPYSTVEGMATIAAMRRVAEEVYARPTWTPAQLRDWAEQECLRMPPR